MKAPTNKEARRLRDADFERRMKPRLLWDSKNKGTYRRKEHGPLPGHK